MKSVVVLIVFVLSGICSVVHGDEPLPTTEPWHVRPRLLVGVQGGPGALFGIGKATDQYFQDNGREIIGGVRLAVDVGVGFRRWGIGVRMAGFAGGDSKWTSQGSYFYSVGPFADVKLARWFRLGASLNFNYQLYRDCCSGDPLENSSATHVGVGGELNGAFILTQSPRGYGQMYLDLLFGYKHFVEPVNAWPVADLMQLNVSLGYRY